MRVENREVVKKDYTTVYIAEDGTEFKSAYDCIRHDEGNVQKRIEECEDIVIGPNGYPNCYGEDYSEDNEYQWYKPLTVDAVNLLNESFPSSWINVDPDEYVGRWLCIKKDLDYEYTISTLEDGMIYVAELCQKLGYTVTFQKEDDA